MIHPDYPPMTLVLASGEIKMPLIKDYLGVAFEALDECGPASIGFVRAGVFV